MAINLRNKLVASARNAIYDQRVALRLNETSPLLDRAEVFDSYAKLGAGDAKYKQVLHDVLGEDDFMVAGKKQRGWKRECEFNGTCFVAGTLVHTNKGLVPIEQIKVGDMVLSKHEGGEGEQAYKRVISTFKSAEKKNIVHSNFLDNNNYGEMSLFCTQNHPFWVDELGGWTPLKDFPECDQVLGLTLRDLNNKPITVRNTPWIPLKKKKPYQPRSGALHFLIDSTGIKFRGEGEWKCKKHGAEYRRQWRKVHLGIDAETLEIRAIEVTDNSVGDAPMLPELLSQIPESEPVATVSGDGAYDTRACHEAIAAREAAAVIPIRKNGKPWKGKTAGDRARNEILEATQYLGRPLWKKWSGYHRRSLVETKMRYFKQLGERVMARDPHRQVVELQVRAAILNSYTRLGVPHTLRVS